MGKPAYYEKEKLTPEQGLHEIKKAGGLPVLAHPVFLDMSTEQLDGLVARLKGAGLAGIEVYYTEHDESYTKSLLKLAERHRCWFGRSDFHGTLKKDIKIEEAAAAEYSI